MNIKRAIILSAILAILLLGLATLTIISQKEKQQAAGALRLARSLDVHSQEETDLQARVTANPRDDGAYVALGSFYFFHGKFDESQAAFEEAVSLNPRNESALLQLANLYRYRGQYVKSEDEFLKALRQNPDHENIYVDLGKLYRNMQRFADAERMFQTALRMHPQDDTIYSYGLGYLYLDMGKLDKA